METSLNDLVIIFIAPIVSMLIAYGISPSFVKNKLNTDPGSFSMIEPLRGLAATLVVVHHSFFSYNITYHGGWSPINKNVSEASQGVINVISSIGGAGVIIFFMITGFLFLDKALRVEGNVDFKRFYITRFFRIAPAYFFVIAFVFLIVLITGVQHYNSANEYVSAWLSWLTLGLTNPSTISEHIRSYLLVAGVLWTLLIEWKFYSLYPLMCQFSRMDIAKPILIISFFVVCGLMHIKFFDGMNGGILLSFISGGLSAVSLRMNDSAKKILGSNLFSIVGLLLFVYFTYRGFQAYSPGPCISLFVIFISVSNGSSIIGILKLAPVRWLGAVSYSLYLSHGVFLFVYNKFLMNGFGYIIPACFAIFSAIIFSIVSYCFVETKGIAFGRLFHLKIDAKYKKVSE